MNDHSHDIYTTKRTDDEKRASSGEANIFEKFWFREYRRSRRVSSIMRAALVGIVFLIIGVTALYYRPMMERRAARIEQEDMATRYAGSVTPLDFDGNLDGFFVTDHLSEIQPIEVPDGVKAPLNAQWIKQAAYHVVQAEQFEQDEFYDKALASYEKALSIFPEMLGVHQQIGLIYLREKEYEAAAEAFSTAAKNEGMSQGIANNLGVAYMGLEEYETAEEYLQKAVDIQPDYALALLNLATLYFRNGDIKESAAYYEKYLPLEPTDLDGAQAYALLLVRLKDWDRAAKMLQQISERAPDVAPVYFRLAQALANKRDADGAIRALQRGTSLVDPGRGLEWMARSDYDSLREQKAFQELAAQLSAASE